jgi:serine/threonine protein kinase
LDHIQLGEWVGSGGWSDVFDAIILDKEQYKNPPCNNNNNNNKNKTYIIKFTGDIATDGDVDHAKSSITAVEVVKRLSPHPSIPENLYFVPKIPNPFPNRFQLPNITRPVKSTTGAEQMNRKRLLTSKYMSIQVSEKVTQTHNHMHGYMPGDKLRCFLYRFFQVLDYAHSKNIMMIDLVLYNVILQDGVMKFIDWSDAMFFETEKERSIRIKKNITYPYAFCSAGICSDGKHLQFDHVHEYDVKKLAYRISRLLKYYDVMDMEYDGYKRENDDEYYFISTRDRKLIQDLLDKMSNEKPAPTLGWLLENHDYFTMEDSSNCTLLW